MFKRCISPAVALGFMLAACGCYSDEIREDIAGQTGEIEDDTAACVLIEETLTVELSRSTQTPASAYDDLSFHEWCERNIRREDLENFVGNAAAWEATEADRMIAATSPSGRATRPTLAQGVRLDLYVLEPEGPIPFVRKIHFADWQGPRGTCALEMRVYQRDLDATGKKPLLYLHGGGWRNRTTTMTAAEVLVSHLVDSHVVFMPAYPLNRDKDGPNECRLASFDDILASVQQAFDWVNEHMSVFGVNEGAPIDLMGHSAGGQLATWLGTQNRARTGRVLNFYGPVEFAHFIDEAKTGGMYANGYEYARRTVAYLFGVDSVDALERPYPEAVMENSLSEIVAERGVGAVPPYMMLLGNADTTVPIEQVLRACEALGGAPSASGGDFACGSGNRAIILDGADHNFDRRCVKGAFPEVLEEHVDNPLARYCPAANADPAKVRGAVRAAYAWLRDG